MESILTSIKKLLGITEEDGSFNDDIVIDINSVLMILNQLGVGPDDPYYIVDDTETWEDFLGDDMNLLGLVKSYIHLKVRLMFDTATLTSPQIEMINRQIAEFEWRLNVMVDTETENE